jgi:hypothetical protein
MMCCCAGGVGPGIGGDVILDLFVLEAYSVFFFSVVVQVVC